MKRFLENPISTILGIVFIAFAGVLFFVPTLYEIPLYAVGIIAVLGLLLILAKDKLVDILTLGLSRLVTDVADKAKSSIPSGGVKDPNSNGKG